MTPGSKVESQVTDRPRKNKQTWCVQQAGATESTAESSVPKCDTEAMTRPPGSEGGSH